MFKFCSQEGRVTVDMNKRVCKSPDRNSPKTDSVVCVYLFVACSRETVGSPSQIGRGLASPPLSPTALGKLIADNV